MPKGQEHGFRQIERDIKDDAFKDISVVLLYGPETFLTESYERRLRERFISPSSELLDLIRFDGDEAAVDDIIAACDTFPLVSERKVVSVAHYSGDEKSLATAQAKSLAEYIGDMPPTTLLIISAEKFSKRSALYKAIESCGRAYCFEALDKADAKAFVRGRFGRAGLHAGDDIVSEILNVTGYASGNNESSLYDLDNGVRLIAAYAQGSGSVGMADVAACLGTSAETNVFAMLDAVSSGRKGEALELLMNTTARGENPFGLLALMLSQFELMLSYKELASRGSSFAEILKALDVRSDWRLRKIAGFADRYDEAKLMSLLDRLYRVDADIKTGLYPEDLAVTMFIAEF